MIVLFMVLLVFGFFLPNWHSPSIRSNARNPARFPKMQEEFAPNPFLYYHHLSRKRRLVAGNFYLPRVPVLLIQPIL